MAVLQRAGWQPVTGTPQVPPYPTAASTGPAAWSGYAAPTPVTISANTTLPASGYPSWVTAGTPLTVTNVAFTITAGTITVSAPSVTFQGCSFTASTVPGVNGPTLVNLTGAGPYVFDHCTMNGADGTSATRVMLAINQGHDAALTVSNCNLYY